MALRRPSHSISQHSPFPGKAQRPLQGSDPLLPGIANGFYRLIDRHSDAGDGQNLLERASLNVTLAVYDADSDTLYFCEMDT